MVRRGLRVSLVRLDRSDRLDHLDLEDRPVLLVQKDRLVRLGLLGR